ncbi:MULTISPECIES: spore coat protein [unclassified Clostridium]|uniref:spore coat protein n=1 Tax=unclassified Clostridium TaxID=2614128 RepID=UPI000297B454|nr:MULTISPECIES: spore coat protein [unclassified Clostridium]EKQ56376.1 MAG: coat F domain-containing protein [Clostridium sp. Maddingley MBC34-26]
MANIISNMIKSTVDINDETIASSMLSAAKEGADMYLNATLTSNTPELKAIYSASLGQMVEGHTTLTELNVNKGWIKPYDTPIEQLTHSYCEAKEIIDEIRE